MKVLIIYDSVFGNTEKIAQAMGAALAPQAEITTLRIGEVKPEHLAGLDVLLVGSPTRAFSPTPAVKDWPRALRPTASNKSRRRPLTPALRWIRLAPRSFASLWTRAAMRPKPSPMSSKRKARTWPRRLKAFSLPGNKGR